MDSIKSNASGAFGQRFYEEWEIEKSYTGHITLAQYCKSWNIPIFFSVFYLLMVFQGKKFMAEHNSYSIRKPMLVWSTLLATFSVLGTLRCSIVVFGLLRNGGVKHLICNQAFYTGPITKFWAALFTYSKFIEYGDTAFILLRKQNLIFLHWYHHLTVALFSWLMYGGKYAGGSLFMPLNYTVHSFMYTYYAVRAAGKKPPRFVSVFITVLQEISRLVWTVEATLTWSVKTEKLYAFCNIPIAQMVLGCTIMVAVIIWGNSGSCSSSLMHQLSGTLMYGSYLVLFMQFFFKSYIWTKKPQADRHIAAKTSPASSLHEERRSHKLRKRNV